MKICLELLCKKKKMEKKDLLCKFSFEVGKNPTSCSVQMLVKAFISWMICSVCWIRAGSKLHTKPVFSHFMCANHEAEAVGV